jgi:hypothetical protein
MLRRPVGLFGAVAALTLLCGTVTTSCGQSVDQVQAGFRQPPDSARPNVLWFWMNGNVTRDGITRDLEAMKRAGIGGALIFDGGIFIPKGQVDYLGPEWLDRMAFATKEADRLGLDLAMHNGPGWSSSGGPWITPKLSMKQLVWTELHVTGPQRLSTALPQPYTKEGYYRDVAVLAFPSVPGEEAPYNERLKGVITSDGTAVDAAKLVDGDLKTGVELGQQGCLQFEFAEPFEARSITVYTIAGGPRSSVRLETSDDGDTYQPIAKISISPPRGIEFPGIASFPPVRARYFRLRPERPCGISEVALDHAPRIEEWNYKGHFAFRLPRATQRASAAGDQFAIDPGSVRDLSSQMNSEGRLTWDVPAGSWTILRFGQTSTGQLNISAPDAGRGLECDKFDREAAAFHFRHVIGKVLDRIGPLAGKTFVAVSIDSYEAEMQNWTAAFPDQFQRRNGYDPRPYLPAMTGRIVGSGDVSDRFLFDVRRTQADLMADNYYGAMADLCHEHGLQLYVEPYGAGPFNELQVGGRADVPMTEFWTRTPWGDNRVVKSVASAAHIYGKPVVAAEAFTSEQEMGRWLEHPYAMKSLGDLMFSLGFNKAYFHRYAHQPHPTAVPGMTMGPWGIQFDRTNTWFEKCSGWLDCLARCQYLLQQGTYVADVLYFVGERTPESAQYTRPKMPQGFTYDLVNAEVLRSRVRIEDGRIVLPEGTSYRLLVVPDDVRGMTPELLERLSGLVAGGMTLLGPKPEFSLTLRGYPAADKRFAELADEMWGASGEAEQAEGHPYGKGRVYGGQALQDVLGRLGVEPDFEFTSRAPDGAVAWLHRRLPDGDIYFVANRQRRPEDVVCSFRSVGRQPELWDSETGAVRRAAIYATDEGRVRLPLHLEPAQSVFVVLRSEAEGNPAARSLSKDGTPIVQTERFPQPSAVEKPVENTFTIAAWVKPDTNFRAMTRETVDQNVEERGMFYAVPAPDGEAVFGSGHAAAGIAAARNGVFVIERGTRSWPAVLVANMPLSGWTHVAVVYRDGRPRLYVNGKFVREGLASGKIVHPAVGLPPGPGVTYYFEGDMTRAELFDEALSDDRIAEMYAEGVPPPDDPPPAEVYRPFSPDPSGSAPVADALVWQSGDYRLDDGPAAKVDVGEPTTVSGPWQVSFPAGRGAPASIALDQLVSLHKHPDPGVRYFSGTATYTHALDVPAEALADGRRVVLDLGRVEVIAEVCVNGKELGTLWKPPFRVDVTDAVHPGENELVVRVTNTWPNRLIGDEQLPAENDYAPDGSISRLPDWYTRGEPKPPGGFGASAPFGPESQGRGQPSGRTTFATWHFYDQDAPLVESGLVGPVRLLNPVRIELPRGANTPSPSGRGPG